MQVLNFVCDFEIIKLFSEKFENFEKDFGKRYTKTDKNMKVHVTIEDAFVMFFHRTEKELPYKYGKVGNINLYNAGKIPLDEIWVFDSKNKKHIIKYHLDELIVDFNNFLSEKLYELFG